MQRGEGAIGSEVPFELILEVTMSPIELSWTAKKTLIFWLALSLSHSLAPLLLKFFMCILRSLSNQNKQNSEFKAG